MKTKQTAQSGSFNLQLVLCSAAVCSMITGTLLAFFHPEARAKSSHPAGAGLNTYTHAHSNSYPASKSDPYRNTDADTAISHTVTYPCSYCNADAASYSHPAASP